jgi:hypothetical protein
MKEEDMMVEVGKNLYEKCVKGSKTEKMILIDFNLLLFIAEGDSESERNLLTEIRNLAIKALEDGFDEILWLH